MRKLLFLGFSTLLFFLVAFNTSANYQIHLNIKFYDHNLEEAIRDAIDKPIGVITKNDALTLTHLDLNHKGIKDLRGLEEFIYLEELDLSYNDLDNDKIHVIGHLIYLEELNLRETGITNIAFLRNLLLLKKLNLHSNPIESIKPIKDLQLLEELILRNVEIGDQIIYLEHLTKLKKLNIRNTFINDFSVIIQLMRQGALQNDDSSVDISDNPGLNVSIPALLPYWENIREKYPIKLDSILPPNVSHDSGFYNDSFYLTIKPSNPENTIYYTIDGSEPNRHNLNGTTYHIKDNYPNGGLINRSYKTLTYKTPLKIYNRSIEPNQYANINTTFNYNFFKPQADLFKANVIRVKECTIEGYCSDTVTETYFVHPDIDTMFNLPIISITTNPNELFSYENGIYVAGKVYNDWKQAHPYQNGDGASPANYNQRDDVWEKEANLSFFESDGTLGFNQNIGVTIQGAYSRAFQRKSLRLYARNDYDDTNAFYYDIFPGLTKKMDDTKEVTSYKRLILRNGGNLSDTQFHSDAIMQGLVSHLSFDTQAYRPAIHFINGEYWGIANIRERFDENYLQTHYGIDEADAVIMSNYGEVEVGRAVDAVEMYNLRDYVLNHDMKDPNHYKYVESKLDIQNFIEYHIANIYYANTDWPGNNIRFWRKRDHLNDLYGHDGKWRFMLYDTDFGFGNIGSYFNHETLPYMMQNSHDNWPNPKWSTALFRRLLENNDFKNQFINTFADQLNTSFYPTRVRLFINQTYQEIKDDVPLHYKRWNSSPINNQPLIDFGNNRHPFMYSHISNFFNLGGTSYVTLKTNETGDDMGYIRINTIDITKDTPKITDDTYFVGQYFKNSDITVKAIPKPGYKFVRWLGSDTRTIPNLNIHLTKSITLEAVFEKDPHYEVEFYDSTLKKELSQLLNKERLTINDLETLDELDLNDKNITSLEGLQYATNLTSLDLGHNNINDLSPIQDLTKLKTLNLDSNIYLNSIRFLRDLNQIEELNLNDISIGHELGVISNMTKLEKLSIKNTGTEDLSVIIQLIIGGALKNRDQLDLGDNLVDEHLLDRYYPDTVVDEKTNYIPFIIIPVVMLILSFTIFIVIKRKKLKSS